MRELTPSRSSSPRIVLTRRMVCVGAVASALLSVAGWRAPAYGRAPTLRDIPMELAGNWGGSPPEAVSRVLARIREVCLARLNLVSDQQPKSLRIDNHRNGNPAIWLHADEPKLAWIIV